MPRIRLTGSRLYLPKSAPYDSEGSRFSVLATDVCLSSLVVFSADRRNSFACNGTPTTQVHDSAPLTDFNSLVQLPIFIGRHHFRAIPDTNIRTHAVSFEAVAFDVNQPNREFAATADDRPRASVEFRPFPATRLSRRSRTRRATCAVMGRPPRRSNCCSDRERRLTLAAEIRVFHGTLRAGQSPWHGTLRALGRDFACALLILYCR